MSKKYMFGVPNFVFVLILLGIISVLLFEWLVLFVVIPIFGYYVWQLREKNRELEERLAAVEGHPRPPKQD
jgi:protein-S-isoprenylcysteine O-methyltransferase Ste14